MTRWILLLALASSACGPKAFHAAVVVDQSLAAAVFAVDDAQWQACHTSHTLPADVCAKLDPEVKKALQDVKALTFALQATPKGGALPKTLPALLTSLVAVRKIVDALAGGPLFASLSAKVNDANEKAVALLAAFAGGVS